MANLSKYVTVTTIYEIFCAKCNYSTKESSTVEGAVKQAESIEFKIINERPYCSHCAEHIKSNANSN